MKHSDNYTSKRFTFRVTPSEFKYVDGLKDSEGLSSRSEVMRSFITFHREHSRQGTHNTNLSFVVFFVLVCGYVSTMSSSIVWDLLFLLTLTGCAVSFIIRA